MNIDLKKKVILITGASGGIGAAAARYMAQCGGTIAIHFFRNESGARSLADQIGNDSRAFWSDLAEPPNCVKLVEDVIQAYGRIHVLVNNAGVYESSPISAPVDEWLGKWDHTIAANLTSVGVLCRETIRHFLTAGGGRIINIASRAAFRGDDADHLAYAASKGGVVSLSRSIARAYGRNNITSFVIAPGFVRTGMTDEYFAEHGEQGVLSELALNRMTEPEDVAPLIAFVASGQMDHATGCTVDINAGSYVR